MEGGEERGEQGAEGVSAADEEVCEGEFGGGVGGALVSGWVGRGEGVSGC